MSKKVFKPGQPAPASGQYDVVGPKGAKHGEVTAIKGKPLPPTPKPNQGFQLADPTNNGSGKVK